MVNNGRYRHFKGKDYVVLGLARHSETEEELVVYRQDYGDRSLWVRPKDSFLSTVQIDGEKVERFRYLGPADSASSRDATALQNRQGEN